MLINPIYKLLITWLVLLLGLAGSGVASYWIKLDIDAREYQRFVSDCEELQSKIAARLEAHEQTLLGGAATFEASQEVTRQEWHAYVRRLLLSEHFNGIQGLGFSLWIPPAQLSAHEASIRAEGFADYKVRPEGQREDYSAVIFLEPFADRNLRAFGYDMYSEPVRRAAMARARDENIVTLSEKVTLVQETDKNIQAGTLMYVPVYQKNKPIDTIEQRRAVLFGWVYSPLRMNDLLKLSTQDINVRLRVYDGNNTQAEHLLYDSNPAYAEFDDVQPSSFVEISNNFNGTLWTLQFEQIIGTNGLDYSKAWIALGTGVLISILLFLLANSYLNTRANAAKIAAKLTEQLQESESRFRVLADSAPVLIWLAGVDKLCYHFNKVWLDFTGRTLEQEQGNGWAAGVHADDLQRCLDTYVTAFDAHLPFKMEYRLRRYDGEYCWVLDTGIPRFADDGAFLGYIGSCVDITERKLMEEKLKISEEKSSLIINSSPVPLVLNDNRQNILFVNPAFIKTFGYDLIDIPRLADWWPKAYPDPDYRQWVIDTWQARLKEAEYEDQTFIPLEVTIHCKDNSQKTVLVSSTIMYRMFNEIHLVIFYDITELKQIEQELFKQRQQLQSIITGTNAGTWEWNVQTGEVIFNERWANIIGYELAELEPVSIKTWLSMCHPDDLKHSKELLNKHFAGGLDYYDCECRVKHKQGHWIWILDRGRLVSHTEDGKPLLMAGIHIDITQIKRTETELRIAATVFESQEVMLIADANEVILKVNRAFTQTTGYSAEEVIGKTPRLLQSGRHDKAFYAAIWQSINETGAWQGEVWNRRKNGEIYPEWLTITAVNAASDRVTHYVATMTDITERKRVENTLRENQVLLQTAQQAAKLGHYVLDYCDRTAITWTNDALFDEIFGIDEYFIHDLTNLAQVIHPEDAQRVLDAFQQVFNGQAVSAMDSIEYRVIRPNDGVELWIESWGYNFYDNQNNPIWQAGLVQDITVRKHMEQELKASEEKFRSIIEISPVPMMLNDGHDNIIFINPAFTQTFGYEHSEIPTRAELRNRIYPDANYRQQIIELWTARLEEAEYEHHAVKPLELKMRCKNGEDKTILASATAFQSFHDLYLIVLYDITERKQVEAELRIAATVFESQEGMLITDANEIILSANQAFTRITGYGTAEIIGQTPRVLSSGRHDKVFYQEMWQSLHDAGAWQGEIWNRRKNGDIYPEWLTITAVKGDNDNVTHYVSTMADISERKATEEFINRLAFYDPLTQLPNRRLLQQRIKHGIELNHRTGSQMAVLMMDLDKFKAVNDTLGHAAGDELLQQVAKRVKNRLREVDLVARLGGDEFVILIENVNQHEHLAFIAESIIHTLSQAFTVCQNHKVYIGASIGIAIHPQHGESEETLMDNADTALYHAKEQGRGRFAYFSEELTLKIKERAALEARLRYAIEQQELRVYFQPQIDINTGQLLGAEALVRWEHPIHGCLLPKVFIALAEDTGLIVNIGEWVLREVCRLGRQWLNEGLPTVTLSVNVSPYQFRRCDVQALVTQALNDSDFPAGNLALEITETGLMNNQENALTILNNLHEQGVGIVIDNFGTGYSSLAYLKYLPIDIVKIDRNFINDIPFSQDDCAITSSIIAMAHHLGFKVLAEGVETAEQLVFLRQQGCDKYQGHLYSQVLPADEFAKLLKQSAFRNG